MHNQTLTVQSNINRYYLSLNKPFAMKTFIISLLLFCSIYTFAQTKKKPNSVSVNTLIYCIDKLHIEDADTYFLSLGYKFRGTTINGDTTNFRYKKDNSYQSFALGLVNDKIVDASFFTNSDNESAKLMKTVKPNGFSYIETSTIQEGVTFTTYQKGSYFLRLNKKYYPEDLTTSFFITLTK
jgi:hypothetical protein